MGLTPEALAGLAVPDAALLVEAAAPVRGWLARAPEAAVRRGLERTASAVDALLALGRLLERGPAPDDPATVEALLRILGGSGALAATLVAEGPNWPALVARVLDEPRRDAGAHAVALAAEEEDGSPAARAELSSRLRRYRRREMVRIGGRDLLGLAAVDETMREISALADALLAAALAGTRARLAREWGGDPPVGFVILGMGKLGGEELNYSSDIDLVYVYEEEGEHTGGRTVREFCCRLAEEVTRAIGEVTADGFCFRVDLRLRPGGGQGPIAVSLPGALSYYEAWGQTWERAVWLKARPVAGDLTLGRRLLDELEPFVYRRYLDFGTLDDLKAMKRRVDASLREGADRNVKLGRGGIRSVEFWVQAQQLIHGGKDPRVRERSTLGALARLAASGYVPGDQAERLAEAYRFLRDVEHKLQIVRERQTQLLPTEPDELMRLGRRLGFLGEDGVTAFRARLAAHTAVVDGAFRALFHGAESERQREERPEIARLVDELDQEEQTMWRLAQLGFRDLETALGNLRLLRDGPPHAPASPRRRAALSALAPHLVREVVRSAAPDRALGHLATFVATIGARTSYLHLLLENPGVLRLLVRLFATSEFLSRFFLRHPEVLDSLVRADLVRVLRTEDDLRAELRQRLAAAPDVEAELDTLRRFRHEEFLRIGVHDIEGELTPAAVAHQLSLVAEVVLGEAVGLARRWASRRLDLPEAPAADGFAVLAMGKLGGRELAYHSDLDLIFVYDPGDSGWWQGRIAPHELFTRVAQRTISVLQTVTREGVAYRIDTRLRPSGNQGPLVTSLEAFERYHETHAALWERQALVKARPVVGPPALRARLEAVVARAAYRRGLDAEEVAELERMRERIAAERGAEAAGRVNIKTDWGGLVDVEFAVQLLQLQHGHREPRLRVQGTREALDALEATGLLAPEDVARLRAGYDFLRALESRLRIERDQPVEALAEDEAVLAGLARRLGYEGDEAAVAAALRREHQRHREGIRAVWNRVLAAARG